MANRIFALLASTRDLALGDWVTGFKFGLDVSAVSIATQALRSGAGNHWNLEFYVLPDGQTSCARKTANGPRQYAQNVRSDVIILNGRRIESGVSCVPVVRVLTSWTRDITNPATTLKGRRGYHLSVFLLAMDQFRTCGHRKRVLLRWARRWRLGDLRVRSCQIHKTCMQQPR